MQEISCKNEKRFGENVDKSIDVHGGDIYRNLVEIDFSVNVNPLGMPKEIEQALHEAIYTCMTYPDMRAEKLCEAVSKMYQVKQEYLLFGNGASELFLAIVHGLMPKKTVIPVPAFYGYEYAAGAVEGELVFYEMKQEQSFELTRDFLQVLTSDVDVLFLANPNNPTGKLIDGQLLEELIIHCEAREITVVLDECFIEFCKESHSMLSQIERFANLIVVRAFTKIFAIPGVRLGYLACQNEALLALIRRQLPEWNFSSFAQAAGCAGARQTAFIQETVTYVDAQRKLLEEGLKKLGMTVYPSATNFILMKSSIPLYELLLEQGILIRDCANFRGLSKGFYRIAVKRQEENERLLKVLKNCLEKE